MKLIKCIKIPKDSTSNIIYTKVNDKPRLQHKLGSSLHRLDKPLVIYQTLLEWEDWHKLDNFVDRSSDGEDYQDYSFTLEDLSIIQHLIVSGKEEYNRQELDFIKLVENEKRSEISENVTYIYQNEII